VRLVALYCVHRALGLGDADAGALQRGEKVHAHHRVGDVVVQDLGEEVAQLVAEVALVEAFQHAARRRRARHVGDRELAHLVVDDGNDARRRHAGVDHEVEDAAPLQRRTVALADDLDARLHQHAVRDHHGFPVARLDQRGAPADVAHAAAHGVEADPVADAHRVVELQRDAGEHVAEGVLHRKRDHRRQDGGGGDEAGEIESRAAQLHEAVDDVKAHDRQVLGDARQPAAGERQEQPERGEAAEADEGDRGDEARDRVHGGRSLGEVERPDEGSCGFAGEADEEEPQRVEVGRALLRPRMEQRDRQAEGEQREPRRRRAPERERINGAVQKRILPVSISFHITQSPMKLYRGWVKVAGRFFSKRTPAASHQKFSVENACSAATRPSVVPTKCSRRQVRFACCDR
jgi:hypothetical protein